MPQPTSTPLDVEVDITRPNVARVYDYALGGSRNFGADRAFAAKMFAAMPQAPQMLRDNRHFLARAVRALLAAGVDQFIDLGAGLPTVGAVHEIAPRARVVYVDHDPVVVAHSAALLADTPRCRVLAADLREVDVVLGSPQVRDHLDLGRPLGVLLVSVVQFLPAELDVAAVVARYAAAPGRHVVISHPTVEGRADAARAAAMYDRSHGPGPLRPRTHDEVAALFGDLQMLGPGLVRMPLWCPDEPVTVDPQQHSFYAGIGRRPPG